jgi:hypothetical protein
MTSGGVRVRNVAQPLIQRAYALFHVDDKHVGDETGQPSAGLAYARHMSE